MRNAESSFALRASAFALRASAFALRATADKTADKCECLPGTVPRNEALAMPGRSPEGEDWCPGVPWENLKALIDGFAHYRRGGLD